MEGAYSLSTGCQHKILFLCNFVHRRIFWESQQLFHFSRMHLDVNKSLITNFATAADFSESQQTPGNFRGGKQTPGILGEVIIKRGVRYSPASRPPPPQRKQKRSKFLDSNFCNEPAGLKARWLVTRALEACPTPLGDHVHTVPRTQHPTDEHQTQDRTQHVRSSLAPRWGAGPPGPPHIMLSGVSAPEVRHLREEHPSLPALRSRPPHPHDQQPLLRHAHRRHLPQVQGQPPPSRSA
jgi:hypothetical protein